MLRDKPLKKAPNVALIEVLADLKVDSKILAIMNSQS